MPAEARVVERPDAVIVPALVDAGIPVEDARDFCNDGCWETTIAGPDGITMTLLVWYPAVGPFPDKEPLSYGGVFDGEAYAAPIEHQAHGDDGHAGHNH